MLQTRLENEQFNSLPILFTNTRSRNDFITTNRPDSSQLVDLHVYIIPKSVWKNLQHLAQNEAMDDAISAGFVRVSPDLKLYKLRESIELLCGKEIFFPREFIFLRSVGRNLTRVKPTQENELKVKHYRPPQTLASEIYLLEGRHEDYANIPSVSPALSTASYVFGRRYRYRLVSDDYNQESSRLPYFYHQSSLQTEKNTTQVRRKNPNFPTPLSKTCSRFTHVSSDLDDLSPNTSVTTSTNSRELNKLKEEQERLRQRQAELERMRRAVEEKKLHSDREENERQRHRKEQEEEEEEERRRRKLEKEQAEREEEERRRRKLEKEQAEREEEERRRRKLEKDEKERRKKEKENEEKDRLRRRRRDDKAEAERRRKEQLELAATKIQASFRGFKDRQVFRERQRNLLKTTSAKSHTTNKQEKKIDINNDNEFSDGSSEISSRTSIDSSSDLDSNLSRPETRTIKKDIRESIQSNSSLLLSSSIKTERKSRSHPSSSSYTITNHEIIRAATVTKIRSLNEDVLPCSTPDMNDEEEEEEEEEKTYEIKRRHDLIEEKRKAKELEEKRRKQLANSKEPQDIESLHLHLQELRKNRAELEKVRDEVIKNLKYCHQRVTLRRQEARDMWKKKYFQEKKKTPSLEEKVTQLKTDLDFIRSKIIQTIDNECKHSAQAGCIKEAETGNLILQIKRIQYDGENTLHQINQAKLRLTTDIKLRNQAENECKSLKHELAQAKMNLNYIKKRLNS